MKFTVPSSEQKANRSDFYEVLICSDKHSAGAGVNSTQIKRLEKVVGRYISGNLHIEILRSN